MGFLWAKQSAILDNIANAETPGYKAKVVTYEETLREKLERAAKADGSGKAARKAIVDSSWKVEEQEESTRMDDNGVNITEQSVEMVRNAYQLQYVLSAINGDLSALRTAIQG